MTIVEAMLELWEKCANEYGYKPPANYIAPKPEEPDAAKWEESP